MRTKMKTAMLVISMAFFVGCGDARTIDGVRYGTYGLFNESTDRSPDVCYETIWGNVVWGVLLVETVVAPVYFLGWSLYEPTGHTNCYRGGS